MYLDGLRHAVRGPTDEEVQNIEGETQNLGFGEFDEFAYVEALAKKPKYAEFLMDEGKNGHSDMKKSTERAAQGEDGIIADTCRGDSERKKDATKMPTVGVEFGFLIINGGGVERKTHLRNVTNS